MSGKRWVTEALQSLVESLRPVPHEVNELDWKAALSDHKDRLAEHLMAFAKHRNGGTLVFGVANSGRVIGVEADSVAEIANKLANLGREAVEPPLVIDHAVVDYEGAPILLVRTCPTGPESPLVKDAPTSLTSAPA